MKIKNIAIYGLEQSIIRSGYPMQTGEPAFFDNNIEYRPINLQTPNLKRARKLANIGPGTGHDNFLKGIIVQFDLCYTQYITKQVQRYNWIDYISSQSMMHRLVRVEDIGEHCNKYVLSETIAIVNKLIDLYNRGDEYSQYKMFDTLINYESRYEIYMAIISNCPMGYQLWTGVTTNYLQLKTIYKQRKNHKLKEDWGYFCNFIEELPMSELIIKQK